MMWNELRQACDIGRILGRVLFSGDPFSETFEGNFGI
jgi:hypothetical protein